VPAEKQDKFREALRAKKCEGPKEVSIPVPSEEDPIPALNPDGSNAAEIILLYEKKVQNKKNIMKHINMIIEDHEIDLSSVG